MGVVEESERAARWRKEKHRRQIMILLQILVFLIPIGLCALLLYRVSQLEDNLTQMTQNLDTVIELLQGQTNTQKELEPIQDQSKASSETEPLKQSQGNGSGSSQKTEQDINTTGAESQATTESQETDSDAAHKVYLTFDDGPSSNTEKILDILDKYEVKATFFVLGKESEADQQAYKEIVERGHTLGMHSYNHNYSEIYRSVEDFAADFTKLQNYLYEVTGVRSLFYRFPGGSSNTISQIEMRTFAEYLEEQDTCFFDWNVSSGDGGSYLMDVNTLVTNCTQSITERGTSVVLMHDSASKSTTVEALPIIIEKILEMEDTQILPITDKTTPVQHISFES